MVVFEMNHNEVLQNEKNKRLETSKKYIYIYSVLHYIKSLMQGYKDKIAKYQQMKSKTRVAA